MLVETIKQHNVAPCINDECVHSRMLRGALSSIRSKSELYARFPFFKQHLEHCPQCQLEFEQAISFAHWKHNLLVSYTPSNEQLQKLQQKMDKIFKQYQQEQASIDQETLYEKIYIFFSRFSTQIFSPTALGFYLFLFVFILVCNY